ncbi:MAG TPA: aldo/keto reductase, partial [Solirubrobacteraceae bacterium]
MKTARLGYGCAGLMRIPSGRKRQDLLAATLDAGIAHFDTARMYGLGAAEAELGRFARGRRDRMTIATKFGIEPTPTSWMTRLQRPARALLARFPALRKAVKRREGMLHEPHRYDVATARASLERSLAELGTDYLDFFFVHDPQPEDEVPFEDLREFLDGERQAGRILAWGVAGEARPAATAAGFGVPVVVQARQDVFSRAQEPPAQIAFGVLARALARILEHVGSSEDVAHRWAEATGEDCRDSDVVTRLLLQDALQANPAGAVLFTTTRRDRVGLAAGAL